MHVEFITPEQKFFSGEASGVKLPGLEGFFEILNNHAPLIAALKAGKARITTTEGNKFLNIKGGFVEVLKNNVVVLVEGAVEA